MRVWMIAGLALACGCELDEVHHGHDTLHADEAEHDEHEHCCHDGEHAHAQRRQVSPEAAARIVIFESERNDREMEAVGIVDAHERQGHHDEALQELREQAAALDAEAVVGVEFHHGEGHGAVSHLSGVAVRYRQLRRDEPFDVVGFLDVSMDMWDQDRAIAELQRQAKRYAPDLIIDIHYEHGEGNGEKIHLTGKAIRYRTAGDGAGATP
jgi:uncharacterized protein YbjQ (UPF0145 family)